MSPWLIHEEVSDGVAHKHLYLICYSASSNQEFLLLYDLEEDTADSRLPHISVLHIFISLTQQYLNMILCKKSLKNLAERYTVL